MELEALFPNWRIASTSHTVPWNREFDLADDGCFYALLGCIVEDQSAAANQRPAEFTAICSAVITDILALQAALPEGCNSLNLHYLQFESTIVPLRHALARGDLGSTHDWIVNGCGDDLTHVLERQFHNGRLQTFVESEAPWIAGNRGSSFTDWACGFYYYCRRRSALFEVAVGALPTVLQAMDEMPPIDERVIEARCMITNWAATYNHPGSQNLVRMLEMLFDGPGVGLGSKVKIATMFATKMAELTDRTAQDWAVWAMQNGQNLLGSHEPFQLLLVQIETVADWDRLQAPLLRAAQNYATSISVLRVPTQIAQATDQRSGILSPAVVKAMRFERGDDLLTILTHWYNVPVHHRLAGGVLFVTLNHIDGIVYLGEQSQVFPRRDNEQMTELVTLTNQALGLAISIEGEPTPLRILDRMGQPDFDLGVEFLVSLTGIYRWAEVDDQIVADRAALILFPGQPHPVQALMADARNGVTLPISSSLQQPAIDRPIRRAMLWSADNDNYSGIEVDAVQFILERAGVVCDRRSGANAQPEDFYAAYSDPDYDLLWVAAHGEIDHWSEGSTRILAGENCMIGIDDLFDRATAADGRRLFVMNICDGGVSAVNGGIQRLGLAPLLASAHQATISHLWPVRPQVASAFGALLAHSLTDPDVQHFSAFADALQAIHGSSHEVTAGIRNLIPELPLAERLENTDLETENVLNWGSACFFQ